MKLAEIHKCDGCQREKRLPLGSTLEKTAYGELCERCDDALGQAEFQQAIKAFVLERLAGFLPGDRVRVLVDGHRGRFKGEVGLVLGAGAYRSQVTVKVPGKYAPGEKEEYQGPYGFDQLERVDE